MQRNEQGRVWEYVKGKHLAVITLRWALLKIWIITSNALEKTHLHDDGFLRGCRARAKIFSKVRLSIMCLWNPNFKIGGTSFKWALFLSGMTLLYAGREWYRYTVQQQQQTDDDSAARGMQTLCTFPVGLFRDQLLSLCSDRNTYRQNYVRPSMIWKTAFRTTGQRIFKQKNTHSFAFLTTRRCARDRESVMHVTTVVYDF